MKSPIYSAVLSFRLAEGGSVFNTWSAKPALDYNQPHQIWAGISARHSLYRLSAETETLIISRFAEYSYCFPTFLPCLFKSSLNHCVPNSFSPLAFRNCYWSQCKHFSRCMKFREKGIADNFAIPNGDQREHCVTAYYWVLTPNEIQRTRGKSQAEVSQLYSSLPLFQVEAGNHSFSVTFLVNLTVNTTSQYFSIFYLARSQKENQEFRARHPFFLPVIFLLRSPILFVIISSWAGGTRWNPTLFIVAIA